jgi:ribosome biogenesis GTPase A
VTAVALSCKKASDVARIPGLCEKLAPHRGTTIKPLRMMIMGIPNVGKSTLMNALLNKRVAKVGDEPAVTKNQQCHQLNERMTLTDSPGLMWPKIEHPEDGLMLAAIHAIGRNAVIEEEIAAHLANILLERYPAQLAERFGLDVAGMDGIGVVKPSPKARLSAERQGRGTDLESGDDPADGIPRRQLGRISLETPETREAMLKQAPGIPVDTSR